MLDLKKMKVLLLLRFLRHGEMYVLEVYRNNGTKAVWDVCLVQPILKPLLRRCARTVWKRGRELKWNEMLMYGLGRQLWCPMRR